MEYIALVLMVRMCEIQNGIESIAKTAGALKVTFSNCLFVSKDHTRSVEKRICVIFMACSGPLSLSILRKEDEENHSLVDFHVQV